MIHRQTFYAGDEHFWSMKPDEQMEMDAAFIALIFLMLALGTQFVTLTSSVERKKTAEFYASASNQVQSMFSYLSNASRSIQVIVLNTYFLIKDNYASDGWAFTGILIRQAYAMGLRRDPSIGTLFEPLLKHNYEREISPNVPIVALDASVFKKQKRRKLWQAVLLQDTFLTLLLSLPPSATRTDVFVEDLLDDGSSIDRSDLIDRSDPTNTAYIRPSWALANLVQVTICSPCSLEAYGAVYRSFPGVYRSWDTEGLTAMAKDSKGWFARIYS
jgi:hypothetical protein